MAVTPRAVSSYLVPTDAYHIDSSRISDNALQVITTLQKANFGAYLVGGAVRDLLRNNTPKDFDVATEAKPDDIVSLFKRAKIIGRRFKIVHVYFPREIIEVTTFRGKSTPELSDRSANRSIDANGLLIRDNVFGSIDHDASRRDFTCNALYFDPTHQRLYDFYHGLDSIKSRVLKMIGDPESRFVEDPVRILRAVRFCSKLGFAMDKPIIDAIPLAKPLLDVIPPSRRFDEALKLVLSEHAPLHVKHLHTFALMPFLFPTLTENLSPSASRLIELTLANTQQRLRAGKSVTPAFILAAFLWPRLQAAEKKQPKLSNEQTYATHVLNEQMHYTAMSKRVQASILAIWHLQQPLLTQHSLPKAHRVAEHPKFRAAYDFLLLREQSGEFLNHAGDFWTHYQKDQPVAPVVRKPRRSFTH